MSLAIICDQVAASIAVKKAILDDEILINQIDKLTTDCVQCLQSSGKVIFAGSGGSFSYAQHLSAEFISRLMFDRAPLASGVNNSAISVVGNDYGYEQVFPRKLQGVASLGSDFIPITSSVNSPNILVAVEQALKQKLKTIAITGKGDGKLVPLCDCLSVP